MPLSPTAEGFRAAFRRPSLTLAEIMWRWVVGATATALFFFGLIEYLYTLPVTNGELLLLRTRHPYFVAQAIAHIMRGSLNRAVLSALLATFLLACVWMLAASIGRMATVKALLEYFRERFARLSADSGITESGEPAVASNTSADGSLRTLVRLSFLRISVVLAAIVASVGAAVVAGFASPSAHPRPGLFMLLFVPIVGLAWIVAGTLNWLLSLAAIFVVRDGEDAVGAISAAVNFWRTRTRAVSAVTTWVGLAHLVAFVAASTAVSTPLGLAPLLPWRLVVLAMLVVTLAYFAVADWLYTARLAGYVCIAEIPEALLKPAMPIPATPPTTPPVTTTIDRDEPILSDVPGLIVET